jgi:hypothetical protein
MDFFGKYLQGLVQSGNQDKQPIMTMNMATQHHGQPYRPPTQSQGIDQTFMCGEQHGQPYRPSVSSFSPYSPQGHGQVSWIPPKSTQDRRIDQSRMCVEQHGQPYKESSTSGRYQH